MIRWYRVNYQQWAAGGRMIPTWMEIWAVSPDQALSKVKTIDRKNRNTGYFNDATVEECLAPYR